MKFYVFKKDILQYKKFNFFRLKYILWFIFIQIFISYVFIEILTTFFDTPKEKKLKKDIASGMNESRKDLNELIKLVVENKVNKVFISYKDRLTRFGYNYFEYIFKIFGTEIEVVNLTKEEDFQTELTQDLISIIHHFSMKMHSNRRKELNALKKVLQQKSENN